MRARGLVLAQVGRDAFPLPTLAPLIADWASELATGRGFLLVRSIPVAGGWIVARIRPAAYTTSLSASVVPPDPGFRTVARAGTLLRMPGRTQSRDTSVEIERRQIEAWRAMNHAQKLAIVSQLTLATEALARAGILERHPNATGREIELRLGALRLDRDTMIRVFAWDPEKQGY